MVVKKTIKESQKAFIHAKQDCKRYIYLVKCQGIGVCSVLKIILLCWEANYNAVI